MGLLVFNPAFIELRIEYAKGAMKRRLETVQFCFSINQGTHFSEILLLTTDYLKI